MKITEFTGVAEKAGILVSKACQVIAIKCNNNLTFEKIEVSLVDFTTGKETHLMRKEEVRLYGEVITQAGNMRAGKFALIEISDGRDLELNANRVLRINMSNLTPANTYTINTIESGLKGGIPAVFEQLIVASGIKTQRFPINDGELLILPKTGFSDIRIVFDDKSEVRMDTDELNMKAIATNGIIQVTADEQAIHTVGSLLVHIIDLKLHDNERNTTRNVVEVEINLEDGVEGYTIYKVINLAKPGFDSRF